MKLHSLLAATLATQEVAAIDWSWWEWGACPIFNKPEPLADFDISRFFNVFMVFTAFYNVCTVLYSFLPILIYIYA